MSSLASWGGALAVAFWVGSLPTGVVVSQTFGGPDPRQAGSRSTGATNVSRVIGPSAGVVTLIVDALKGAIGAWAATAMTGGVPYAALCGTVSAACGHAWSPWLRGRGGKAVATSAGGLAVADASGLAVAAAAFALGVVLSRRISVGSLCGCAALPLALMVLGRPHVAVAIAMLLAVLIGWWHRDNLRRLWRGDEPEFEPRNREAR